MSFFYSTYPSISSSGSVVVPAGAGVTWLGRGSILQASDGYYTLTNSSGTDAVGLALGQSTADQGDGKSGLTFGTQQSANSVNIFKNGAGANLGIQTGTRGSGVTVSTGRWIAVNNGAAFSANVASADFRGGSTSSFNWTAGTGGESGSLDTGLARSSAGVVAATLGTGQTANGSFAGVNLTLSGTLTLTAAASLISLADGDTANASISMRNVTSANFGITPASAGGQRDLILTAGSLGIGTDVTAAPLANKLTVAGNINWTGAGTTNGASATLQTLYTTTTTNGGGATATVGAIPAGALVYGVVTRVTTTITGCTTFSVGDGTTADKWGSGLAVAATTTAASSAWKTKTSPLVYTGSENVTITAAGGTFTGGVVETVIYYMSVAGPTS